METSNQAGINRHCAESGIDVKYWIMKTLLPYCASLMLLVGAIAVAQEKPGSLPFLEFEGDAYVLGSIDNEGDSGFVNTFYKKGVNPKDAKKTLSLHFYPNLSDPKDSITRLIKTLNETKVPLRRMTTDNPNLEGVGFTITKPDGSLEFNLFYYIKVPEAKGLYAKHFVVIGKGDMATFMVGNNKKSQTWVSEIAKTKFPRIIRPKTNGKQQAGPDLSKIPDIVFQKESFGDVDLPGLKMKGLIVGSQFTVDEAFTKKWENAPPSIPFSITVPKNKLIRVIPGGKKTKIAELLKVQVAAEDGKRVVEIIRFAKLQVSLQKDPKDRIKLCAWVLQNQGLNMAFRGKKNGVVFETYATKIGSLDAVVVNGKFDEPDGSATFFVKLVGVLDSKGKGGVMVYQIADSKLSPIKKPEDLRSKGIGQRILHSLKFIE